MPLSPDGCQWNDQVLLSLTHSQSHATIVGMIVPFPRAPGKRAFMQGGLHQGQDRTFPSPLIPSSGSCSSSYPLLQFCLISSSPPASRSPCCLLHPGPQGKPRSCPSTSCPLDHLPFPPCVCSSLTSPSFSTDSAKPPCESTEVNRQSGEGEKGSSGVSPDRKILRRQNAVRLA